MTASRLFNALCDAKFLAYEVGEKTGRANEYRRIAEREYSVLGKVMPRFPI